MNDRHAAPDPETGAPAMTDALRVDGVTSGYGRVIVLRAVTVRVGKGEIVCLLGSNGAGKSTLLKTIAGLLHPRAGTIALNGKNVTAQSAEAISRAGIVLVPEGRQLFATMSVLDNLMLGAYAYRRDRSGTKAQLRQVHELFPILRERVRQPAGSLSGGQQQMLAIGRGLMARPRVLLLDEPSLGLAPLVLKHVFDALGRLRELGVTVLLVEQNATLTLDLADRGYVLERGQIAVEDSAANLKTDPRVKAAYLGLDLGVVAH